MTDCVDDFIHSELGCCLPWVQSCRRRLHDDAVCSSDAQFDKFRALLASLEGLGTAGFVRLTGCAPRCEYDEHTAVIKYAGKFERQMALFSGHE